MYKSFFGLKENPFNANPDPRYLVLTRHAEEALAALTYGIVNHKGFILLTGEVGTGKTTLLNRLLDWAHPQGITSAFIFNPRLSATELLDFMMADFGINCVSHLKSRMLLDLNQWLLERHQAGQTAALIIDEAQDLSLDALEEIRLLGNLEIPTGKLLQVVLSGQPELEDKLKQPELRQLHQRFTLRSKLPPLTVEEAHQYVTERLRIAGAAGPIFAPAAIETAHACSRGIPRVINLLGENALISAFVHHEKTVSAERIEEAAEEFDLEPDSSSNPLPSNGGTEAMNLARDQATGV